MNDAEREAVQGWLFKAKRDLATARRLASKRSPFLDTAVYHCQQSAGKALKGFLVYNAFTPLKFWNPAAPTVRRPRRTPPSSCASRSP